MGRIHVLEDSLINRIAAGEVVERPASVVKELVENALDAGARSISVSVLSGGKRRIRIVDDGCGMDRDDAILSLERHATSKLSGAADLEQIRTLGFRGEALSSIGAVSRLVLQSSTEDGTGTEIEVRGGRIQSVREAGLPRGTSILIERLFFNVPARRKFLRSESTELSHVTRLVTRYALAHPGVRFRLEHGDRVLVEAEPAQDRFSRIEQLFGRASSARLLPFASSQPGLEVAGFAGRPTAAGPRRDSQHFFVNGRTVQDRLLLRAVSDAYGNTMPRGRYASVFLFIDMAADAVDVNVHPQKTEVRFGDPPRVRDAVRAAVASALSRDASVPELRDLRPGPSSGPSVSFSGERTELPEPGIDPHRRF